ncbi:hypothetical protein O1611_g1468 [Lasiodiplodia mahajangana]|uniref:Uncharacterized protein n=1 Tax=Lasiodiplodia mahajangana TaxID=1108764 RepID=A0ACC2JXB5_9PEZI|nr:hypothetical protein O1611_g1468 [Lasiodiplodia mahajangana]
MLISVVAVAPGSHYEPVLVLVLAVIGFVAREQAMAFFVFGGSGIGMRIVVCDVIRLLAAGAVVAVRGLGHGVAIVLYRGSILRKAVPGIYNYKSTYWPVVDTLLC